MSDFPFKSITAEQVTAIRAANPNDDIEAFRVYKVRSDEVDRSIDPVEVLARVPRGTTWDMFQAALRDDVKRAGAGRQLIMDCVLAPSRSELEAILGSFPGTENPILRKLSEMAGNSAKIISVKF